MKRSVFVSYSSDDFRDGRVTRLVERLRQDDIEVIHDSSDLRPGDHLGHFMLEAIDRASIIIVVCSPGYRTKASERTGGVGFENDRIIAKYQSNFNSPEVGTARSNVIIIPVLMKGSSKLSVPDWLRSFRHIDFTQDSPKAYEELLSTLLDSKCRENSNLAGAQTTVVVRGSLPTPVDHSLFVGRDHESLLLDGYLSDEGTRIVKVVADGGFGKSALVWHWIRSQERRGQAPQIFKWSFYSQGQQITETSSDQFVRGFLDHLQELDSGLRCVDRRRLEAVAVSLARSFCSIGGILILDGLEPLQHPPAINDGQLRDIPLRTFLAQTLEEPRCLGTILVTTRWDFPNVMGPEVVRVDLDGLSLDAGVELLRDIRFGDEPGLGLEFRQSPLGSRGTVQSAQSEFEKAVKECSGHALSLLLLASYLVRFHHGDLGMRGMVLGRLSEEQQDTKQSSRQALRIMRGYDQRLGAEDSPLSLACREFLHILGLFDRPAEVAALESLVSGESITSHLTLSLFTPACTELRRLRLLPVDGMDGTIDTHPLIREHFGRSFLEVNPTSFLAGHSRLSSFHCARVPGLPDSRADVDRLFLGLAHAASAKEFVRAFDEIYRERITCGDEYRANRKFGTTTAELCALSHYFHTPWSVPHSSLRADQKVIILRICAFHLNSLGRRRNAHEAMQSAYAEARKQRDQYNMSVTARYLSSLSLVAGDVPQAINVAEENLVAADGCSNRWNGAGLRATLGDALHYAGRCEEAEQRFAEAERIQKVWSGEQDALEDRGRDWLDMLPGYQYCDLLLRQGRWRDAIRRAMKSRRISFAREWHLETAMADLIVSRAIVGISARNPKAVEPAIKRIESSVEIILKQGEQDRVIRGRLGRAEVLLQVGARADLDRAQLDLNAANELIKSTGMRLFEVERAYLQALLHLRSTRLSSLESERQALQDKARAELLAAQEAANSTGYRAICGTIKGIVEELGPRAIDH